LGKQFKQKIQAFEQALKEKINQKTKALTAKLESRLDTFKRVQQDLDEKKKHAKEKLGAIEAKIDALKKEKEANIKSKKNKKLDKLKDRLKDKLKNRFR